MVVYRQKNKYWLTYSIDIALKMLEIIRKNDIDLNKLAIKLEISKSKLLNILKGRENLDLEILLE